MVTRLCLLVALTFVSACSPGGHDSNVPYGLRANLQGAPPERTWVEPAFEKIATLSSGKAYTLFNAAYLFGPEDGHFYVWDGGDNKLKAFTLDGEYVRTYGDGKGSGPGQVQVYRDVGIHRDSLYVLDPQNRRLSYFSQDGEFGRSTRYEGRICNIGWLSDGTRFELYLGARQSLHVEITDPSGYQTTISDFQTRNVANIVLDGLLQTTKERAVYMPLYYPLLLTFTSGDTSATAYPTPDYGGVPVPEPTVQGEDGFNQIVRPPSNLVNRRLTADGKFLSVQLPSPDDRLHFDIYDARELAYIHSVRLPVREDLSSYAYQNGFLATARDTTVDLYRVERPEP